MEQATLGGGCFWCTEAVFQRLKGVEKVVSGYSGGEVENPSYDQISTGKTGHIEVIQITFNPKVISYQDLLEVFFNSHDPTTPDRQGPDVGTQYSSVIFYHSPEQKRAAVDVISKIQPQLDKKIVTQLKPFEDFYKAEGYHQNYYNKHQGQPYCTLVINPKLDKLKKGFPNKLKPNTN